jgi:DNA repair protein RadC
MRIAGTVEATQLLAPELRHLAHEELRFAYLDADLHLLRVTCAIGQVAMVDLPLRRIMRDALLLDAEALIMAHNHPGGSITPSAADRAVTRRLSEICRQLDISLIDHLIFAGDAVASFRTLGLL